MLRGNLPNPPKLDTLVTRAADDYVALGADRRVQHAGIVCVTDLPNFVQGRVRVHHDRVVREAVRGEHLLCERGEPDRGHLRGCGERVEPRACIRIPEVHGRIAGPATGGEKGSLPRTPSESLLDVDVSGMEE